MAQKITVKVAQKSYELMAPDPDMEQIVRLAAESVNKRLAQLDEKFKGQDLTDKLADIAIRETSNRLVLQRKLSALEREIDTLSGEMQSYLTNNKN